MKPHRDAWGAIVLAGVATIISSGIASGETSPSGALFARARTALVIISTAGGSGSGCIVSMGGKRYLVTNEHVTRSGLPLTAKLLNGAQLVCTNMAVANDRDLVRFELAGESMPALAVSSEESSIGDAVAVFGNSDGGGVVTSIAGKVLGVGPERIEVDAPFVSGNSGSPIIDTNGAVLGIATYVTRSPDPNGWVKEGTRFAQVRRFGLRLRDVKWVPMTQSEYQARVEALQDLETYCNDAYALLYTDKYADPQNRLGHRYDFDENKRKYRRNTGLCRVLADVASQYAGFASREVEAAYYARMNGTPATPQQRRELESARYIAGSAAKDRFDQFKQAFAQIYQKPAPMILKTDWITQHFKTEAMFWNGVLKGMTHQKENN